MFVETIFDVKQAIKCYIGWLWRGGNTIGCGRNPSVIGCEYSFPRAVRDASPESCRAQLRSVLKETSQLREKMKSYFLNN